MIHMKFWCIQWNRNTYHNFSSTRLNDVLKLKKILQISRKHTNQPQYNPPTANIRELPPEVTILIQRKLPNLSLRRDLDQLCPS